MWTRVGLPLAAILAGLLASCSSQPSPDLSRALHLRNEISQAVVVSVGARGSEGGVSTAIRPCGGALDLVVGREIPSGDDWLIGLSIDPSGSFDNALAAWAGDPADMPGDFTVSIIWSAGDIHNADLPASLVVQPDGVVYPAPNAAAVSAQASCAPWAAPMETP